MSSYESSLVWCPHSQNTESPLNTLGSQIQEKRGDLSARKNRGGREAHTAGQQLLPSAQELPIWSLPTSRGHTWTRQAQLP